MELKYGIHSVAAVLRHGGEVDRMLVRRGTISKRLRELVDLAQARDIEVERMPSKQMDDFARGVHQGVILVCKAATPADEGDLEEMLRGSRKTSPLLLILDGVTDARNLGACIRSAAVLGADGVVIGKDRSAGLTATTLKTASGAAEYISVFQVTNLARTLKWLKQWNMWLIGLEVEADRPIERVDLTGPVALILGAEDRGLRRITRQSCDFLAQISMHQKDIALNVSVAAGICLFEAKRQRIAKSMDKG